MQINQNAENDTDKPGMFGQQPTLYEALMFSPTKKAMWNVRTHELYASGLRTVMIKPGIVGNTPITQATRARQWKPRQYL